MFDNLREQADSLPFYEAEDQFRDAEAKSTRSPGRKAAPGHFLGLSPVQRFILAIMLLIAVCALSSMCLLITGRISLM
jgi:hypothetical protein